jgi:hypothetical protein
VRTKLCVFAALTVGAVAAGSAANCLRCDPVARRHDVTSPGGSFVLDVDPEAERLTVFAAGEGDQPLWWFDRNVWRETYFLSDRGDVVGLLTWRYVPSHVSSRGVCLEFWDQRGKFREYTYDELCPRPVRCFLKPWPNRGHWRQWYSAVEADGTVLRLRTTDGSEFEFSLEDGSILRATPAGAWPWPGWAVSALVAGVLVTVAALWWRRRSMVPARDDGTAPT